MSFTPYNPDIFSRKGTFERLVLREIWIINIQVVSFLILMVCLIRIPTMSLAFLFKEVCFSKSASTTEKSRLIAKWKKQYFLIYDLVADINDFLGPPLFFFIIQAFLTSINFTFEIIVHITTNGSATYIVQHSIFFLVQNIICISILTSRSEQLPQQASYNNVVAIQMWC